MGTMLLSREIPPFGGDTMFANQYAAYEALSPAMRALLDPLRGIASSALADVSKTREDRRRDAGTEAEDIVYEASHPVVRTHPETGRKALFVNVAHTARFDGMTEEESKPLLQFLFQHQVKPEFTCRFVWGVGSTRAVGQPLRPAQPGQRLPRLHAGDAPHHTRRRRSGLISGLR